MSTRSVYLATENLDSLVAGEILKCQHWAVGVSGSWFELERMDDKRNTVTNNYSAYWNEKEYLPLGLGAIILLQGKTAKGDEEIMSWSNQWMKNNPKYHVLKSNCQKFAYELIMWLTNNAARLPAIEAANVTSECGARAYAVSSNGESKTRATCGMVQLQTTAVGLRTELPNAGAGAQFNNDGIGAYANAEAFNMEYNLGLGQVYLSPNLNTGIGKLEDGKVGVNFLGFGLSVGKGRFNWRLNTPLGGFNTGH